MEIRFVSSLTPEDEEHLASAFLPALAGVLDLLPIAYSIQVRTTSGKTLDRVHGTPDASEPGKTEPPAERSAQPALNRATLDPLKLLLFNYPR